MAATLGAGVSLQVGGVPQLAHAAGSTRYVDQSNPNCSNVGSGTSSTPFCTIQAAANAAAPGDTVLVSAGTYNEIVTIKHSGTAGAPITFKPAAGATVTVGSGQLHGFAIMGSTSSTISYITITGFNVTGTTNYGIYLKYNSNIILTNNHVTYSGQPVSGSAEQGIYVLGTTDSLIANNTTDHNSDSGIYLTTGTTNVTVQGNTSFDNARQYTRAAVGIDVRSPGNFVYGNLTYNNEDSGIQLYNGANNTVVANNISYNNGDHGIDCLNSTKVVEVSNTVYGNATSGINVEGTAKTTASQGATIRNNISVDNGANSSSTKGNIRVDVNSTTGSTADYDLVYQDTAGAVTLTWGTKTYTSISAFTTASGQETHGFGGFNPQFENAASGDFALKEGSVAIDSAASDAVDQPGTDYDGNPRVDDPNIPNIGVGPRTYDDRGALEYQPLKPPKASLSLSPSSGSAPLVVSADASGSTDPDGTISTYAYDFGDGSAQVGPQTSPTASHTYQNAGTYTVTLTVTDNNGLSGTATATVTVTPPSSALRPSLTVTPSAGAEPLPVTADASGSTDSSGYPITSYAFDFGDGTTTGPQSGATATHTYTAVGAYSVTVTVNDSAGLSSTATARVVVGNATVDEVHYNYLTPNSVSFAWRGGPSTISYGPTTSYGTTVTAVTPNPLPWTSDGPYWQATLTGLQPGATYHYSIGGSADETFSTEPTGNFRFDVEGDIGDSTTYPNVATTQSQISSDDPAFVLATGDLSYADQDEPQVVDQHFNDVTAWSRTAAYLPSWGNHDWEGPGDDLRNYKGRFDLPNSQASVGAPSLGCCGDDWGWFDAGGVRFISYPEPYTSSTWPEWQSKVGGIMAAAQADPSIDYIVTWGHRPAYSTGHHPGDPTLAAILNGLGDTYSKYVLNFNGHSHDYERFVPIHGVINITAAGGGSTLEGPWTSTDPNTAFRALHLTHEEVDVTPTQMVVNAICGPPSSQDDTNCTQGTVLDSVTIRNPTLASSNPSARLSVTPASGPAPLGVTADASASTPGSTSIASYAFDWGDGTTTAATGSPTATHTYSTAGSYVVTVTVTDTDGLTATATSPVTVNAVSSPPTANLSVSPSSGMAPVTVAANGSGSTASAGLSITSYSFDWGDGTNVTQAAATASHTYSAAGTYTVTLTVTDSNGSTNQATQSVTVSPPDTPPVAALTVAPTSGAAPLPVTADATNSTDNDTYPIASYKFDFGDATPSGPQAAGTASHTYTAAGTYTITVTVTDTAGESSQAKATVTVGPAHGANQIGNPGFETNTSGWNTGGRAGITLTQVAGGHSGSFAAALTNTTSAKAADCTLNDSPDWVKSTFSGTYTASLWVRADAPGAKLNLRVREYQGSTNEGSKSTTVTLSTTWQQVTLSYTPQISTGGEDLDFTAYLSNAAPGNCFYADDASESLN